MTVLPSVSAGARARRWALSLALCVVAGLAAGCAPRPAVQSVAQPVIAGGTWGAWRTLRAEHKVTVEVGALGSATERREQRSLRGVLAVERPDRFRLRALGPGGITLFDLLYINGKVDVLHALRDPNGETFARLLASIAGDLAAAYDLAPRPADRAVTPSGKEVLIAEPGRAIRLADFRDTGHGAAPARIAIDDSVNAAAPYRVTISAANTELDQPLDPALFLP